MPQTNLVLNFFVPRPFVMEEQEYYVYDISAALGDIGGMLGLLLGTSFFALFDLALGRVCACWQWLGNEKRKDGPPHITPA